MAVSLSCKCSNTTSVGSGSTDHVRNLSLPSAECAVPSLPPTVSSGSQETGGCTPLVVAHAKERFAEESNSPSGYTRWATMVAAAAASVSVMCAAPAVLAADGDVSRAALTHSIPGDLSLSIAIPIPDSERWANSKIGFVAPPPRAGRSDSGNIVVMNYQGGCPAWQPSQFEMNVPGGVRPKHNPRHGNQWPAHNVLDDVPIERPAMKSVDDDQVDKNSLIEALLRMSDVGLTCFSL